MGKDAMPEMSCHDGEFVLPSLSCYMLLSVSHFLKLRANSLDIHWEIEASEASASRGSKGLMRARIGVKPHSTKYHKRMCSKY